MMEMERVLDFLQAALALALQVSIPILLAIIIVGLVTNLIQAVFQLQDHTLSLVPRLIAVVLVLSFLMPEMLNWVVNFTRDSLQVSGGFLSGR